MLFRLLAYLVLLPLAPISAATFVLGPQAVGIDHDLTIADLPGGNGFVVEGTLSFGTTTPDDFIFWTAETGLDLPAGVYLFQQKVEWEVMPWFAEVHTAPLGIFVHTGGLLILSHSAGWTGIFPFPPVELGDGTVRIESFATLVPEPGTFVLLFSSLGLLVFRWRRCA